MRTITIRHLALIGLVQALMTTVMMALDVIRFETFTGGIYFQWPMLLSAWLLSDKAK